MSFGIKKYGVNNTDKKLIRRYVAAGWPLDKIANKLSIHAPVIQKVINHQAANAEPVKAAAAQPAAAAEVESAPIPVEVVVTDEPDAEPTAAEKKALRKAQAEATGGGSKD